MNLAPITIYKTEHGSYQTLDGMHSLTEVNESKENKK